MSGAREHPQGTAHEPAHGSGVTGAHGPMRVRDDPPRRLQRRLQPPPQRRPRRYTAWRRTIQVAVALAFLLLPWLAVPTVAGTLVALKLGPVDLVEPATAVSALAAARAVAWTLAWRALPLVVLAIVLGPVYCAWACPFGLVSELLDRLLRRGPWTGAVARSARHTRWTALVVLLSASVVLQFPLAALLAPPRLLTALPLEWTATRVLPAVTSVLLAAVLALDLLWPRRIVCRALCPAGAVAALLRTRWTLAPRLDRSRCASACAAPCFSSCPWGVDPRSMQVADGCTTCLACIDRCPSGALSLSPPPPARRSRPLS